MKSSMKINLFRTWRWVILLYVFINIYYENNNANTTIMHHFIIYGLRLSIKEDIHVSHMFYSLSFSHNTAVPIDIKNSQFFF